MRLEGEWDMGVGVRKPAVAGSFYPGGKETLKKAVRAYIGNAKEVKVPGTLQGLVVPHAGYIYSGPIAGHGYKLLATHSAKISKAILVGPSHYAQFYGACESGFSEWETPLGKIKTPPLKPASPLVQTIPQAHAPEHCLEVQLPFIQAVLKKPEVTPILTGEVSPKELAEALLPSIKTSTVVIASSDLSHYLPYEEAKKADAVANEAVPKLQISRFEEEGDACGKTAILTLMHMAKKKGWKGKFLDYRNSGDTAGDKGKVVGYGCYAFYK